MNQADWQQIAEEKLLAADALLAASQWPAAYYLAGYAIECGLKSCILVRLAGSPEVIFESRRYSEKCWTHNINELVDLAGLRPDLDAATDADVELAANWGIVAAWDEATRYRTETQPKAQALYNAITNPVSGVMPWIRARW